MINEKEIIRTTKRITFVSGSAYISLPLDWVRTNELDQRRTVTVSIDTLGRVIIVPDNAKVEVLNAAAQ